MSTQYDTIGTRYASMKELPAASVEKPSISAVLGNIHNLHCLDLACGLGYWTQYLLEDGAASVTGVDISETMTKAAKEASATWAASLRDRNHFITADCSQPTDIPGGPFDLVFAGWFLNYAGSYEEQLGMWRNIYHNLKPGGRFIGITVNVHQAHDTPIDDRYGILTEPIAKVRDGHKIRLTAYTHPERVVFENYHLSKEVHERGAATSGLVDLKWNGHVLPDDERRETGYWDVFEKRPMLEVVTACRPT